MSLDALIAATITTLQSQFATDSSKVDEAAKGDGQPPPFDGQTFYAVHEADSTQNLDTCLQEFYGLAVTVTIRAGLYPADRVKVGRSMLRQLGDAVRVAIHMNYDLMNAANAIISANQQENGFIKPLVLLTVQRSIERYPDWFWSNEPKSNTPAGLSKTLFFGQAQRDQTLTSMT